MPAKLQCQKSKDLVSVDQFEMVEREYQKLNKESGEMEEKVSKMTDI